MYNSVLSIRPTSLYGFPSSSVVFDCKTAPFGAELYVPMGPRTHLSVCACKTSRFAPQLLVSVGTRSHLSVCACKTACLASELPVCVDPSLHLWILHAKHRLLDPNYKFLWVPPLICGLWMQKATFGLEQHVSMGPRYHLSFCACITA